ncbi:hypothetical protein BV20DRAFT_692851 [Pilatotrama ljubarskyi]|nr:hypothetical protein BV20DRAFT_692851 [Pilatotrama ljubarskyi]
MFPIIPSEASREFQAASAIVCLDVVTRSACICLSCNLPSCKLLIRCWRCPAAHVMAPAIGSDLSGAHTWSAAIKSPSFCDISGDHLRQGLRALSPGLLSAVRSAASRNPVLVGGGVRAGGILQDLADPDMASPPKSIDVRTRRRANRLSRAEDDCR